VQEAICIYRRDLDNMPGSRREYLNPVDEGTEFLTNAISLSGPALAYASASEKPK
jgi:glutamate synthase (NADPH/NADH) small chain